MCSEFGFFVSGNKYEFVERVVENVQSKSEFVVYLDEVDFYDGKIGLIFNFIVGLMRLFVV